MAQTLFYNRSRLLFFFFKNFFLQIPPEGVLTELRESTSESFLGLEGVGGQVWCASIAKPSWGWVGLEHLQTTLGLFCSLLPLLDCQTRLIPQGCGAQISPADPQAKHT